MLRRDIREAAEGPEYWDPLLIELWEADERRERWNPPDERWDLPSSEPYGELAGGEGS